MRKRWRVATLEDISYVVPRLRAEDNEEAKAMWGITPAQFFRGAGTNENIYCIYNREGTPVALGGVAALASSPGVAQIWMVATPELENHQIEFLKHSKRFIQEVSAPFMLVYNYVHAKNEVHLKWLKWCGFTFINRLPRFGAAGEEFYTFVKVN